MAVDAIWQKAIKIMCAPETKEAARKKPEYFTRERGLGFNEILVLLLNKGNETTQTALNRYYESNRGSDEPISEQAFSKARNRFDESPFVKLFDMSVAESYAEGSGLTSKRRGKYVFAVDGSIIALPSGRPELREIFGEMKGAPRARASVVFDVENERLVAADIDGLAVDERTMAIKQIKKIHALGITDAIFVFDRGYPSVEMMDLLDELGYEYVMRVKTKYNVKIDRFTYGACYTKIGEKYRNVVKFNLPTTKHDTSPTTEALITNIPISEKTIAYFSELYFERWGIETNYKTLKSKIQLEAFSGQTETSIRQDFYASAFLNNMVLIEKFMADLKRTPKESNKHTYKTNINELIGSLKNRIVTICMASDEAYIKNLSSSKK